MTSPELKAGSLVLYRDRPARVIRLGDRLDLELEGGQSVRVRLKDVAILHPGPCASLAELVPLPGEMRAAWEILAGGETTLAEVSELAFGRFTPASAWAAWQFVAEGRYFAGEPGRIRALSVDEVEQKERERERQENEERAWRSFVERVRTNTVLPEDGRYLRELEPLAYGTASRSRLLKDLGRADTPENAHALLLACGYWSEEINPYPRRLGLPLRSPDLSLPDQPEEERRDLTGLEAYAIDDAGTDNPDDALSLEGERICVHVADPAALILPGSELDREACERGMTLHLPEGPIHFVPEAMIHRLGLGLNPVSPALSFGIDLDVDGGIREVTVEPSWVRVKRLSYEEANQRMGEELFRRLEEKMTLRRRLRERSGAIQIELPEARIKVSQGIIRIDPILPLRSRLVVEEAMILAGEAAARFALRHGIPLPFSTQEPPSELPAERSVHATLSEMFAMRRLLKRSRHQVQPAPHAGLGVEVYAQATSPLRRGMDLAVHQQLRASLAGRAGQTESELLERIGAFEAVAGALRQAEMNAERHWTLVYLKRHPEWRGEAVLVEKRGANGVVLLPDLGLEARLHLKGDPPLDTRFQVRAGGIHLTELEISLVEA